MTKMTMTMTMTILTMMTMCDDDGIDIVGKENMTFGFWKWIRNWIRSWKTKQLSDVVSIHSQPSLLAFLESKSKKTTIKMKMRRIQMNIVDVEPLIRFILRASWANTVAIERSGEWMDPVVEVFSSEWICSKLFWAFLPLAGEADLGRAETRLQQMQIQIQIHKWNTHFASCGRS